MRPVRISSLHITRITSKLIGIYRNFNSLCKDPLIFEGFGSSSTIWATQTKTAGMRYFISYAKQASKQ